MLKMNQKMKLNDEMSENTKMFLSRSVSLSERERDRVKILAVRQVLVVSERVIIEKGFNFNNRETITLHKKTLLYILFNSAS